MTSKLCLLRACCFLHVDGVVGAAIGAATQDREVGWVVGAVGAAAGCSPRDGAATQDGVVWAVGPAAGGCPATGGNDLTCRTL